MDDSCVGNQLFSTQGMDELGILHLGSAERSGFACSCTALHCIALLFTQHGVFSWKRLGFGLGERGNESAYLSGYLGI